MSTSYENRKSQVEAARQGDGRFGSYSADESGATLGIAPTGPKLTERQRRLLAKDSADRARHHEGMEQVAYEELGRYSLNEDGEFDDTEDLYEDYRNVAEQHNSHVAARVAFEAPPEATVARVASGALGNETTFYDRDGDRLGTSVTYEFHSDESSDIDPVPAEFQYTGDGAYVDECYLDLDKARRASDGYQDGIDGPGSRSSEVASLQRRASMRRLSNFDDVEEGDHIEAFDGDVKITAGEVHSQDEAGFKVASREGSDHTYLSWEAISMDHATAYTDRQRELQPYRTIHRL